MDKSRILYVREILFSLTDTIRNTDFTRCSETIPIVDAASNVENSCYEAAVNQCMTQNISPLFTNGKFINIYSAICYNVMYNIKHGGFAVFSRILCKINNISTDIGKMSSNEINPDVNRDIFEKIEIQRAQKIEQKVSVLYKCHSCNRKETIISHIQDRAADEGTSVYATCINCNNRWRLNN
jgi:DNA-directed RNA polymerase subunit M/transcription elongation factor TFIIS